MMRCELSYYSIELELHRAPFKKELNATQRWAAAQTTKNSSLWARNVAAKLQLQ